MTAAAVAYAVVVDSGPATGLSFKVIHEAGSAGHRELAQAAADGKPKQFRMTMEDGTVCEFEGIVRFFGPAEDW